MRFANSGKIGNNGHNRIVIGHPSALTVLVSLIAFANNKRIAAKIAPTRYAAQISAIARVRFC
jgi:hypothetical protein